MSNWITIAATDLNNTKVAALVNALRTAALAVGQADPSIEIIANVTARIRAEIKGCASNQLDSDDTTIPKDLKSLAGRMIVREMQSRLLIPLKEDEREEQRNDLRYLERIAKCEVPITAPDDPIDGETQSTSGTPLITPKCRRFTSAQQDGI